MANRRRLLDREELLRQPPLQPKPQFRKFGADSRTWKRPQPAAVASAARQTTIGNLIQETQGNENYTSETYRIFSGAGNATVSGPSFGLSSSSSYELSFTATSSVSPPGTTTYKTYRFKSVTLNSSQYIEERIYCLPVGGSVFVFARRLRRVTDARRLEILHNPVTLEEPENSFRIDGNRIAFLGGSGLEKYIDQMPILETFNGITWLNSYPIANYINIIGNAYRLLSPLNSVVFRDSDGNILDGSAEYLDDSFTKTYDQITTDCFICANNAIRRVTPKGVFAQILGDDAIDPIYLDDPPEFQTDEYQFTPEVFQKLNQFRPFVPPNQIKTFPANAQPVLGDARSGFFSDEPWDTWQQRLGRPANFAKWRGTVSDVPDIDHGNNANYQRYIPIRNAVPPFTGTLAPDPDYFNFIRRFFVWDWDDPAYCRRMCLALGFTPADLTP